MKYKLLIVFLFLLINIINAQNITAINLDLTNYSNWLHILSVILISILTTISGVGGGGLLIPYFVLVCNLDIWWAIPLSVSTIFFDCFIRLIFLFNKKHYQTNKRYLIDLTPSLIIVPSDGALSWLGIIMSQVLSPGFNIICIILVLGFSFIKTIKKAYKEYQREKSITPENNILVIDGINIYIDKEDNDIIDNHTPETIKDKSIFSSFIIFSMIVIAILTFSRDIYQQCESNWWILIALNPIIMIIILIFYSIYLIKKYQMRKDKNFKFMPGDINWNPKNISLLSVLSAISGALSTYLGIGGGMLITPLLINLGMKTEVVIASSAVTTFFSSLISLLNYIIVKRILWDWFIAVSIAGAIGSFIGIKLNKKVMEKLQKQSYLIFFIGIIILISIITMCIYFSTNDPSFSTYNLCS